MFEVKEVLLQHLAGAAKRAIARSVGVDVKTVRRYVDAADALGITLPLNDTKLATVFAALKADAVREHGASWKACAEQRAAIEKLLQQRVRLTKVRKLLERKGVVVPYATLHRYAVRELGFGGASPSVRLADPPLANELQMDTGLVVTLTVGGKPVRKKAFIFTPTVSRYRFVYPVDQESTESAIEACEAAWAFYEGIFGVLQPDNMKAIVATASPTSPKFVEAFREYAQARGITLDPARVRRPKDKARVEKTVAFVRNDCFGGELLHSLDAARTRAQFWCAHEAGLRRHSTTQRLPKEHFAAVEQAHLQPAPSERYDTPIWCDVTVDKTQHVVVAGALYMLPVQHVRQKVRARADKSVVRFYLRGALVKVLPRVARGERSFDKDDIPEHKRAYALRDELFLAGQARAHDDVIGDFADRVLEGPAPWMRMRRVAALLSLVRRFGAARVAVECRRALAVDMTDVDRLRRMVEAPNALSTAMPTARVIPMPRYLRPTSDFALKPQPGESQ